MESSSLVKLFTVLVLMRCSFAEDVCVQKGPCKCVFSNGTGIDLTPMIQVKEYKAQAYREVNSSIILEDYHFFPCLDTNPNSTTITSTCNQKLSLYREMITIKATSNESTSLYKMEKECDFVGNATTSFFSSSGKALIFPNSASKTTILLVCADTKSTLRVYTLDEPSDVVLSLYSPDACLKQLEEVGRSLGSTLLIILFSLVIFYLTLGVLTRKFLMGATGLEVIPNLNFWMDLPNLVKDGWAFARNGFTLPNRGVGPTLSPDPNSYDSI